MAGNIALSMNRSRDDGDGDSVSRSGDDASMSRDGMMGMMTV